MTTDPVYAGVFADPRPGQPITGVAYVGRDTSAPTDRDGIVSIPGLAVTGRHQTR